MKKILFCLGAALFTFSFSYSQETKNKKILGNAAKAVMEADNSTSLPLQKNPVAPEQTLGAGDTVFFESFAGPGLPAGWTQSGVNQLWKHISSTYANPGCYSTGTTRLNSTTKANGTMIYDSDSANKYANDQSCATGGAAYKALSGDLISPSIDLTGKAGVHLRFQQKFRLCCSPTTTTITAAVSGDGGATWTNFDAAHGVNINQQPLTNPDKMDFNISCVAGNKSNVLIKFAYTSESGTYYWELDDVAIVESPYADELVLKKAIADYLYTETSPTSPEGGYYTKIPFNQVDTFVSFRGIATNDGINNETNVTLNVNITGGPSYNQTSAPIASFLTCIPDDTLKVTVPFKPSTKGAYTATFTLNQNETDQNPSNNTIIKTFEVTDTVYARDNNAVPGGTTIGPGSYVGGDVNEGAIGNLFEILKDDEAIAVSFYLENTTDSAASIEAGVYSASTSLPTTPFITTAIYDVTYPSDVGKWVTLPFVPIVPNSQKLYKDSTYVVAVKNYNEGNANERMRIASDLVTMQPKYTSYVKAIPTGMTTFSWGWINVLPRIRLITKNMGVGINELANNGLHVEQNIPNPSNGYTLINYEVNKSSKVSLEVYDITGKLVYSQNEGSVPSGRHSITLNTQLAAGAYSYTLRANEASLTKKMMITK